MKTKLLLLITALAVMAVAQASSHSVTLTWADATNPTGTTYSIYRATGVCSATLTFTKITSGITLKTYTDTTVSPGNYCYQTTATLNGMESVPSNTAGAPVPPFPPTGLTATVI